MPHPVYQKRPRSRSRKTVQVSSWVKPAVKAELQRLAEADGLSLSQTCAALLEEAIRQKLHVQHAVLLQPIIEQAIRSQMRHISTRFAWLLVRIAFDTGQIRGVVTNVLGKQPGMTPDVLRDILDGASKTAKANITRRTPQLVELIEAVEQWLTRDEAGEGRKPARSV